MLLVRDLRRDEDAKMTDAVVQRVDDDAAVGLEFADRHIEIGNPVQRLLRRGDIVAVRCKDDNRNLDAGEVDWRAVAQECFAPGKPVSDEEIFDDPGEISFSFMKQ